MSSTSVGSATNVGTRWEDQHLNIDSHALHFGGGSPKTLRPCDYHRMVFTAFTYAPVLLLWITTPRGGLHASSWDPWIWVTHKHVPTDAICTEAASDDDPNCRAACATANCRNGPLRTP